MVLKILLTLIIFSLDIYAQSTTPTAAVATVYVVTTADVCYA